MAAQFKKGAMTEILRDNRWWLLKTEPNAYSWADLLRDGTTVWSGVTNAQALINIRAMQVGDTALFYHTGDERAAVGLVRIITAPYPDPQAANPKQVVVDVAPLRALARPVTLAQIKAEPLLADWVLVRNSRLSVVPCSAAQWEWVLERSTSDQ